MNAGAVASVAVAVSAISFDDRVAAAADTIPGIQPREAMPDSTARCHGKSESIRGGQRAGGAGVIGGGAIDHVAAVPDKKAAGGGSSADIGSGNAIIDR